jgi:hypothetical protein
MFSTPLAEVKLDAELRSRGVSNVRKYGVRRENQVYAYYKARAFQEITTWSCQAVRPTIYVRILKRQAQTIN